MGQLHRFTVGDYERMAKAGILTEDSRVELIRGRIVDMAAVGSAHIGMINRLNRLLMAAVGERGVVSVQNPVRLDDSSEPEPDVALLAPGADARDAPTPRADSTLLLIEVADSSLFDDRTEKAALYAGAGVPEYWIVNLVDDVVEVHRTPERDTWRDVRPVRPGSVLTIARLPGITLSVAALFGLRA